MCLLWYYRSLIKNQVNFFKYHHLVVNSPSKYVDDCAHAPVLSMRVRHSTQLPATSSGANGSNKESQGERWRRACWKRSVAENQRLDSGSGQLASGAGWTACFATRDDAYVFLWRLPAGVPKRRLVSVVVKWGGGERKWGRTVSARWQEGNAKRCREEGKS